MDKLNKHIIDYISSPKFYFSTSKIIIDGDLYILCEYCNGNEILKIYEPISENISSYICLTEHELKLKLVKQRLKQNQKSPTLL